MMSKITAINYSGISAIEVMVTLTIFALLLALGIPTYQEQIERTRLKAATEEFYNEFKLAHSESIKRQANLFFSIREGDNWCFGLSTGASCDCNVVNNCQIDGVEKVVKNIDFLGTSVAVAGMSSAGNIKFIQFEGVRGTANSSGSAEIFSGGKSATVSMNRMGLINNCSNDIASYPACP